MELLVPHLDGPNFFPNLAKYAVCATSPGSDGYSYPQYASSSTKAFVMSATVSSSLLAVRLPILFHNGFSGIMFKCVELTSERYAGGTAIFLVNIGKCFPCGGSIFTIMNMCVLAL